MRAPLDDSERHRLEAQLLERIRQDCDQARRIKYDPKAFVGMVAESGPVMACIRVITARHLPEDFSKLWELQRLELTAEYAILDGPWHRLFTDEVRQAARKRLKDYGRPDLAAR